MAALSVDTDEEEEDSKPAVLPPLQSHARRSSQGVGVSTPLQRLSSWSSSLIKPSGTLLQRSKTEVAIYFFLSFFSFHVCFSHTRLQQDPFSQSLSLLLCYRELELSCSESVSHATLIRRLILRPTPRRTWKEYRHPHHHKTGELAQNPHLPQI